MAPIRRYIRITKYSALECRIFLDNPVQGEKWLLNPRTSLLARVMESIFPLIKPKLREEYDRSRGKSTKKSRIKDTVVQDDFEVTMFLTEARTRHTLLVKQKFFYNPQREHLRSNSRKLFEATANSISDPADDPCIIEGETNETTVRLQDVSEISQGVPQSSSSILIESEKRALKCTQDQRSVVSSSDNEHLSKQDEDQELFVSDETSEAKKLAIQTTYEGFTIYGRVLYLIVRRTDKAGKSSKQTNQATMENWISSTQLPFENEQESLSI